MHHDRPPAPSRIGALLVLAVVVAATGAAAVDSPPISRLEVTGDGAADREAIVEVLGLREGGTIDRRQIRDAILAMYASTAVDRVRILRTETPAGLEVEVEVSLRPTISGLKIEVGNRIRRKQIEKWLELSYGQIASTAGVEASRKRVERKLRERGFADPNVDIYVDYKRETNTVDLTVTIDPGEPLVIGSVSIEGIDDPELLALAEPGIEPGKRLTARLEDRIRDRVEDRLREAGFWEAEVLEIERGGAVPEVDLAVRVDPGNRYRLVVDAPEEHAKAVRNAVPDPSRDEIHPQQTDALAEQVREKLQEAGFLLAEVDAELVLELEGPALHLTVEPDRVRRVGAIDFPGAASIRDKTLRSAVSVRQGAVRGLRGQDLSDASLDVDRRALTDLYRRQGFPEAEVGKPRIEPLGDDTARIVFPVDEGERWFVTELRIEGLPAETAAALDDTKLPIADASPWDPRTLDDARRRLEGLLADTGYPDGRVATEVDASQLGEARVVLRAEPGRFVRIGRVVIAGLTKTREAVVRRSLRRTGVVEGETFSRSRMLEAQQRLYELALFRRVELVPMPGQERHTERGVVVLLEEGLHKSYVVGVGWNETDRLRVTLGWSHLNLFGGAHAFSVETVLSSREQRYQLGLREPRLPRLDVPAYLVIYQTFEEFATYSQKRRGLWFDIGDRYKLPFRAWYRYEYQIVQPDAPDDVLSELERENQEARISSFTPTFEWDFRDNPLVPTTGTYSELSASYAFPLFDANAEFLKVQGRTTLYGPVANGRGAIGVRLGAIEPLGDDTGDPANLQIPLNTRFFAGGANTHRAFAWETLGIPGQTINDDGNPIGGNALVLINAEYVRKLSPLFSATVFVDAGNVWESPETVRFGDIRWGAGLGLWLDTPAGPLRVEYGFKLDKKEGESAGQWWLSFGMPF